MGRLRDITSGGLYRSRKGVLLGVCRGIADFFNFSVFWTRVIAVLTLIISGFWPITGIYFLAALLMKPEPVIPIYSDDEQDFYDEYVHSRKYATDRLRRRFDTIDRRVRRMEDVVTSKDFEWERKFNT
ncbi:MAG: envelope stress response membrane protein PspC [Deltaproteobacteria bacterium]|nr:envelope stress response membrane protein PspC [Deltaproteobacteria bacterium]